MQRHYVMVSSKKDDAPIPIGVTNHLLPNDENDSVHSMDASYSFLSPAKKFQWLPCAQSKLYLDEASKCYSAENWILSFTKILQSFVLNN